MLKNCFGDEGFAAAGRAVQEDAFRSGKLVLREQLLVHEGQFHRVGDLLDLLVQSSDLVVGDVRHLFQHQIFHFGARQAFYEQP